MTVRLWNLRLLVVWINKNAPHFLYHWKCGVGIALVMSSRKNIMLSAIIPTVKGT